MKALITVIIITTSVSVMFGQVENQANDSIRIALEREDISKKLTQLIDSIQLSLAKFDIRIREATTVKAMPFVMARKELRGCQAQVKLDLEEVSLTSQNGWSNEALARLYSTMETNRRQHKRICTILKT